MNGEELQAMKQAGVAMRDCIHVFEWLARNGRYPEPLMQEKGGNGWQFLSEAEARIAANVRRAEAEK